MTRLESQARDLASRLFDLLADAYGTDAYPRIRRAFWAAQARWERRHNANK